MGVDQSYIKIGALDKLRIFLKDYYGRSVFIVTGTTTYTKSGAKKKIDNLSQDLHLKLTVFTNFSPNPKAEDVKKGLEVFETAKPNLLIAIGGGSAIDMAKLISLFAAQKTKRPLNQLIINPIVLKPRTIKLIAIPTTCGTGSEATHFAVLYIDGKKYSVAHPSLIPDVAIVDPKLMMTLSPYQTASTAMDAFSQAIESYWSVNSTHKSQKYATEAIKLINNILIGAVKKSTLQNKLVLARAANLAGKAINIAKTTAPHALSYKITSKFLIPHGHAVGLTLAEFLVFNYQISDNDCLDKRGAKYVKKQLEKIAKILTGKPDINLAKNRIEKIMNKVKLQTSLKKLGIKKINLKEIANSVDLERLNNNPRKISLAQLNSILLNVFDEKT